MDVFNGLRNTPGFARMVPLTEIASAENDYNLNIPRYIDSNEGEDLHDLGAHLRGGVPNRDIDALDRYWDEFPALRTRLFAPNGREGYSDLRVDAGQVRQVVLDLEDFRNFENRVRRELASWDRKHRPLCKSLDAGHSPKELIGTLAEDLLRRFAAVPLLNRYDVYQCLMNYWDEVMEDDVYLVVTDGWKEAARPRVLVPVKGKRKGAAESPDLTVKRTKYKMDLIPPTLVEDRHFSRESAEVARLQVAMDGGKRELAAFIDEHSGEDGLLDGATTDAGNVTQAAARKRLRQLGDDAEDREECDAVEVVLALMKEHATGKRAWKAARTALDENVLARYAKLTEAEIADIVVNDKWMASIRDAMRRETERSINELVDRLGVLGERYDKPLPELTARVEELAGKVERHLADMGV